jgi:hypothetical protein
VTLLRQTLHSLTVTHTVRVPSVFHLHFHVTGVLIDTAALMIWPITAALTYLSVSLVQAIGVVQISALQLLPLLVAHQKFLYLLE